MKLLVFLLATLIPNFRGPRFSPQVPGSILYGHRGRIHRFLPRQSFEPGENSAVIVLVALHGEAALLIAVRPSEPDEMLLGFTESHQCADPQ